MRISDWSSDVCSSDLEIAAEDVLPRFQALAAHEIHEKAAGEVVTVVDVAVEKRLTARLTDLLPGSLVVGEEAVHAEPALMDQLASDAPVWILDPIDGTRNFAHGRPVFAIMVALAQGGDRKSVVKGKSGSVRVDLGGRLSFHKHNKNLKQ